MQNTVAININGYKLPYATKGKSTPYTIILFTARNDYIKTPSTQYISI